MFKGYVIADLSSGTLESTSCQCWASRPRTLESKGYSDVIVYSGADLTVCGVRGAAPHSRACMGTELCRMYPGDAAVGYIADRSSQLEEG